MVHPGAINVLATGDTLSYQKHRRTQHRTQHRIEHVARVFLFQHQGNSFDTQYIALQDVYGRGVGARSAYYIHQR